MSIVRLTSDAMFSSEQCQEPVPRAEAHVGDEAAQGYQKQGTVPLLGVVGSRFAHP